MGTLDGKVALVTGAASGIGLAAARLLAQRGATVMLADVQDELGAAAATEVGGTYVHLDVSDGDAWQSLLGGFDRLDLLHLNAGIYDVDSPDITTVSDARFRQYLGVNISGVFFGLRDAVPLLEQSRGAVVVTASMAGITALPGNPVYALTKHAVIGLVRSAAGELAARGIRCNAVCPGAVATPLMGDDPKGWFVARNYAALEPEDIAATVVEILESDRSGAVVLHRAPDAPVDVEFPDLTVRSPD